MTNKSDMTMEPNLLPQSPAVDESKFFASERERLHRQMLSSVSHDLKTPLASIIGALEVYERMHDKLSPEKQQTLVEVALQEAYRLDNFVTNILDMAKLENGMVKPNFESVEVGAVIRNCLMRMDTRLKNSLVNVMPSNLLIQGITDPSLLSRALGLVLDNAVKYGGSPPVIDISYEKAFDGFVKIDVRDNGRGIPAAQVESVFSKYTRFAKGDQQNAGTGLGLAISRALLALIGGDVHAANHVSGGAVFTLHFPLK